MTTETYVWVVQTHLEDEMWDGITLWTSREAALAAIARDDAIEIAEAGLHEGDVIWQLDVEATDASKTTGAMYWTYGDDPDIYVGERSLTRLAVQG